MLNNQFSMKTTKLSFIPLILMHGGGGTSQQYQAHLVRTGSLPLQDQELLVLIYNGLCTNIHTGKQTYRCTDAHKNRQTFTQTKRKIDKHTSNKQTHIQTEKRQSDTQTYRHLDKQIHWQTGTRKNRFTDKQKHRQKWDTLKKTVR